MVRIVTRSHGEAFPGVSKHILEGCSQTRGFTVKYKEYQGKDPAVQGFCWSLWSVFMEHCFHFHALP